MVDVPRPSEMADYTAVGLGCARTKGGEPYFIVQYGELPWGCKFCEWFYLHDTSGAQLTRSKPPVLFDPDSSNPSEQYSPNNKEFNDLSKKLGIDVKAAGIEFAECRRDPGDIELCTAEPAHE